MPALYLYRKFFGKILAINDTPESLARGTALGMFIAMTPTVGIQMILVLIINTLCRANRVAGLIMVYVSNPLTMIPIYWLSYVAGAWAMGLEVVTPARFESVFQDFAQDASPTGIWTALQAVNAEIIVPTFVGGGILGVALGAPLYPITLWLVRTHQRRRMHRLALERARELLGEQSADAANSSSAPTSVSVSTPAEEARGTPKEIRS